MDFTNFNDTFLNKTDDYLLASFICAILMVIVAILGIFGNILSFLVFTKSSNLSSINILLAGQAIMDIVLLIVATPLSTTLSISAYMPSNATTCTAYILVCYIYPFAMMAQTATVWATVVITCERFLAVCLPFKALTLCTTKNAKKTVMCITCTSVVYNLCRFWEYELTQACVLINVLRNDPAFMTVYYNWLYFLSVFLIPFVLLVVLNGLIIRTINCARQMRQLMNRKQNREYQTSVMMIMFTCSFLICNSLAFVLKTWEAYCFRRETDPFCKIDEKKYNFVMDLNNFLVQFNSSVPFLIYILFSRCFRVRLLKMINKSIPFYYTNLKPLLAHQQRHRITRVQYSLLNSSIRISFINNPIAVQLVGLSHEI